MSRMKELLGDTPFEQADLFGRPIMTEQDENLARVTSAIGLQVLDFCRRIGVNGQFHAVQLHNHVGGRVAPASADRILRHLRLAGHVDYIIINRRASLYRITSLKQEDA